MARGPQLGKARITVDGHATTVDLYSPTWLFQQPVFVKQNLASKQHSIKVAATGTKNAASAGTDIALDAFDTR